MNKIRVLVADDHTLFREGLGQLLDNEDDLECVAMAADGDEAVKLTKELLPQVVLLDISMPKMDGIEAAKQIKDSCPNTAVVILSAYKYPHYVHACLQAGVDGYLLKNAHRTQLINAIRMVCAGEGVFSLEATSQILHPPVADQHNEKAGSVGLNRREIRLLKLAARGMSNHEIACELGISDNTVGSHFIKLFRKLGVESRTEAVLFALKEGCFAIDDLVGSKKA